MLFFLPMSKVVVLSLARWAALFAGAQTFPFDSPAPLPATPLGGNPVCWELWYNFATCCHGGVWGPQGNPACWTQDGYTWDFCCNPPADAQPMRCDEHLLQINDASGYLIGRALDVIRCLWQLDGPDAFEKVSNILAVAVKRSLEMANPYRTLSLIALEWHHLTGEGRRSSALRMLRYLGIETPSNPDTALTMAEISLRPEHVKHFPVADFGCCDPFVHGGLGSFKCLANTSKGACATSPEGLSLRSCAEFSRHAYPRIRGHWSPWGFDGTTRVGRLLMCLCARAEISSVLDLFAHTGSGSALTAAHALRNKPEGAMFSVEYSERMIRHALINLEGYPMAHVVRGDASKEVPRLCSANKFDLLVLDFPEDDNIGETPDLVYQALEECRPRWFILANVQQSDSLATYKLAPRFLRALVSDGAYEIALHDFSPTLLVNGRLGTYLEYVVLRQTDSQRSK
eukprot:TRINITY_DN42057_c0_g1_i1.p1 TRINITY_DN42057_c0_g1~~TRINITY_DN42057_c0_g1_i1.p1  ORF type:complete len:457 (-),score=28.96 TRINITY_DN42057_c0_g1_i1:7-1377(-)